MHDGPTHTPTRPPAAAARYARHDQPQRKRYLQGTEASKRVPAAKEAKRGVHGHEGGKKGEPPPFASVAVSPRNRL